MQKLAAAAAEDESHVSHLSDSSDDEDDANDTSWQRKTASVFELTDLSENQPGICGRFC